MANASPWLLEQSGLSSEDTKRYVDVAVVGAPPLDLSFASPEARETFSRSHEERDLWASLPNGSVRFVGTKGTGAVEVFSRGQHFDESFWAQDAAATVAASCVLSTTTSKQGVTVLDACAAPGGKTAQLAARGVKVVAADVSEARLEILRSNLER
eukprot:CAMPEP_0198654080 /NCGR_PEP_ID=MMETSP1467-20131203/7470_1 /TAXON_ID=1462469 /ORGANISM="unid. sp., Strain CCMP2135" /LENGTH=154 /DNA_ID=CAMNT_0044390057 /DNA_START=63 /DNA_END=524 /DNA_ORIENTATION=+